jgi:hypothetical protein
MSKRVFTFASNDAGIHGSGDAKTAYTKYGARYGKSYGHYGDSFAIPTKSDVLETLPLSRIEDYVRGFLAYARGHHKLEFQVTRIGYGLGDLDEADIADLFVGASNNVLFDRKWYPYLGETVTYWGRSDD